MKRCRQNFGIFMAVAIQWYTFPVARNSQYFHQKHTYNSRPRRRIGAANGALWEFRTHLTARCARPVVAIYSRITLLCYRVECHQLICIISAADVIIASLIRYGVADGSSARRCLTRCSRVTLPVRTRVHVCVYVSAKSLCTTVCTAASFETNR